MAKTKTSVARKDAPRAPAGGKQPRTPVVGGKGITLPPPLPETIFNFIYMHTTWTRSSLHQVPRGKIKGELRAVLLGLRGPVIIPTLISDQPGYGLDLCDRDRFLLCTLLNSLGIYTAPQFYDQETWQGFENMATPLHNHGYCSKVFGEVCTIWIIEPRRNAIPGSEPLPEDIQWVAQYTAALSEPAPLPVAVKTPAPPLASPDAVKSPPAIPEPASPPLPTDGMDLDDEDEFAFLFEPDEASFGD